MRWIKRFRHGALLGLCALPLASCGPADYDHNKHRKVVSEITIARGPCFGHCPIYSATFRGDGTVLYRGLAYVDRIGDFRGHIQTSKFVALARFILDSDYLRLADQFTKPITDQETVTTTVTVDGKRNSVSDYGGAAPATVWAVEELIDKLLLETTLDNTTQPGPTIQPDPRGAAP
jgi:hypothetical protein